MKCEDGTDRWFRNFGIQKSDAGDTAKRLLTIFKTRRKFGIKKGKVMPKYRIEVRRKNQNTAYEDRKHKIKITGEGSKMYRMRNIDLMFLVPCISVQFNKMTN
jgi:hypothetical protein